jgi:hypothetical protein
MATLSGWLTAHGSRFKANSKNKDQVTILSCALRILPYAIFNEQQETLRLALCPVTGAYTPKYRASSIEYPVSCDKQQ